MEGKMFVFMCVLMTTSNVCVYASENPVSGKLAAIGVKNNILYYIKNKATGLNLDAANRSYAVTKVLQWSFH